MLYKVKQNSAKLSVSVVRKLYLLYAWKMETPIYYTKGKKENVFQAITTDKKIFLEIRYWFFLTLLLDLKMEHYST